MRGAPRQSSTATPTRIPTATLDGAAPVGGSVVINSGASYTTDSAVTLSLAIPSDTSGLTGMVVANGPIGPMVSDARSYLPTLDWTLAEWTAVPRSVYVWFRDAANTWSTTAVSDSIDFNHPLVARNDVTQHFSSPCNKQWTGSRRKRIAAGIQRAAFGAVPKPRMDASGLPPEFRKLIVRNRGASIANKILGTD